MHTDYQQNNDFILLWVYQVVFQLKLFLSLAIYSKYA